jgi:hypothetical protein
VAWQTAVSTAAGGAPARRARLEPVTGDAYAHREIGCRDHVSAMAIGRHRGVIV